jgi:hypothetical protein
MSTVQSPEDEHLSLAKMLDSDSPLDTEDQLSKTPS